MCIRDRHELDPPSYRLPIPHPNPKRQWVESVVLSASASHCWTVPLTGLHRRPLRLLLLTVPRERGIHSSSSHSSKPQPTQAYAVGLAPSIHSKWPQDPQRMLVLMGSSRVVSTLNITEPPAPGGSGSASGVHFEISFLDRPFGSSFMEMAHTSIRLPAIPAGAAMAKPPAPGRPADMPAANRISVQEAMNKLVRRCCRFTPQVISINHIRRFNHQWYCN